MDVRPPFNQGDDALYIDDHDITVVKTEECERRRVFRKSDLPYFGPVRHFVISDSEESDNGSGAGSGGAQSSIKGGLSLFLASYSSYLRSELLPGQHLSPKPYTLFHVFISI